MRIDPRELKMGDIFYECQYGVNLKMNVLTQPIATKINLLTKDTLQWTWEAVNMITNLKVDYTLTEGFGHYGPKLYKEPQYVEIKSDGTPEFKLS